MSLHEQRSPPPIRNSKSNNSSNEPEQLLEDAVRYKQEGNALFSKSNYEGAIESYRAGLTCLSFDADQDEEGVVLGGGSKYEGGARMADSGKQQQQQQQQQKLQDDKDSSNSDKHKPQPLLLCEAETALRSNLALCYLKLQKPQQCEHECDTAIRILRQARQQQQQQQNASNVITTAAASNTTFSGQLAKVYYRRSTSRERMERYQDAQDDVRQCIAILMTRDVNLSSPTATPTKAAITTPPAPVDEKMLTEAHKSLRRIMELQQQGQEAADEQQHSNNLVSKNNDNVKNDVLLFPPVRDHLQLNGATTITTTTTTPTTTTDTATNNTDFSTNGNGNHIPTPSQQAEIIKTFFIQSQNNIQQQQSDECNTTTTTNKKQNQKENVKLKDAVGEAYFIINYEWWLHWCDYVNFSHQPVEEQKLASSNGNCNNQAMTIASTRTSASHYRPQESTSSSFDLGSTTSEDVEEDDDNDVDTIDQVSDSSCGSNNNENKDDGNGISSSSSSRRKRRRRQGNTSKTTTHPTLTPPGVIDNSSLILQNLHNEYNDTGEEANCSDPLAEWRFNNDDNNNNNNNNCHYNHYYKIPLRLNLVRKYHYEIIPREAYAALRHWFGEATPSICRRTRIIQQQYMGVDRNNHQESNLSSRRKVSLWLYPEFLNFTYINHKDQTSYKNDIHDEHEQPPSSSASASTTPFIGGQCGTCRNVATKRCRRCSTVYYCSRTCQESHWQFHKHACRQLAQEFIKNNGHDDDDYSCGGATHAYQFGRNNTRRRSNNSLLVQSRWGRCGLGNLGNTCFMNSALQCLSHVAPLTKYFLTNRFEKDINRSNPLGTKGRLALAYCTTIKELWMAPPSPSSSYSSSSSYCIPSQLKRAIATLAPRFAGCSQHDASEFLAYLLDGLHEDLNRVRDAPYVVMPDASDTKNLSAAAAEAWDLYRHRNDSLVFDTFYGQFKSTCVCPNCEKVSVTFDTFNHVCLELPQNNRRNITVTFFQRNNETSKKWGIPPVKYSVTVSKDGTVGDLKEALSNMCGIHWKNLILVDIYESSVYELYGDNTRISHFQAGDVIGAYEIEPYYDWSMHAIITHMKSSRDDESYNPGFAPLESEFEKIGYPLLTTIDVRQTCRETREFLWLQVRQCLGDVNNYEYDEGKVFLDKEHSRNMRVRVVNQRGDWFRLVRGADALHEGDDESLLPHLDVALADVLGTGCLPKYLFLQIEWSDQFVLPDGLAVKVESNNFIKCIDHPSMAKSRRTYDQGSEVSLDYCFDAFSRPERLDENNKWYCSRCRDHVRAMKTMELWRLPNVLVVHLKRFDNKSGFRREKLETLVDFPINGLDMSRHCRVYPSSIANTAKSSNDARPGGKSEFLLGNDDFVCEAIPAIYDLFAVTNHYGRMGFGHYTAVARRWDKRDMESEWALFDDSSVSNVKEGNGRNQGGHVVTSAAYVLFYRRRLFT